MTPFMQNHKTHFKIVFVSGLGFFPVAYKVLSWEQLQRLHFEKNKKLLYVLTKWNLTESPIITSVKSLKHSFIKLP